MTGKIARAARNELEKALGRHGCALIVGPRQVGKTTLAGQLLADAKGAAMILDMQRVTDRGQIKDIQSLLEAHNGKLIIVDEAQEAPELFPQLRACLDRREVDNDKTRWLLLGSAAVKLTQMAGELGGRFGVVDLWPFQLGELTPTRLLSSTSDTPTELGELSTAQIPPAELYEVQQRIWLRGGFPDSYLAANEPLSLEWRSNYLRSLIGPEFIPNGVVSRPELVQVMWEHLAINQGEPLLLDKAAQRLGCKVPVVREMVTYLMQARLLRVLRPWFPNEGSRLDKPPRCFIRDSGLLHTNWGFPSVDAVREHQGAGKSWEGFVLESIAVRLGEPASLYFYQNERQQELDILIDFGRDRRWAIEVKLGGDTAPRNGFYEATKEVAPELAFVIGGGPESIDSARGGVPIYCLSDALALIDK